MERPLQTAPSLDAQQTRRNPKGALISLIMALLYGASPIDLIPDVILLLGWVDDAFVVPLLLLVAWSLWRRRSERKRV